jgi:hypothetical protein
VAVLYDEREGQIIRVLDAAPAPEPRARRFNENDDTLWAARGLAAERGEGS